MGSCYGAERVIPAGTPAALTDTEGSKSPQRELGMTPVAESLAGSSGGQLRFIKQLILLTDNSPPPRFNSYRALRSSCLFILGEWNYLPFSNPLLKTPSVH